jgi:nuclear GTP-binding protein
LRKNREGDFDGGSVQQIAKSNPLNRKALKKDAKRARRLANRQSRLDGAGMDVDEMGGLDLTFMA